VTYIPGEVVSNLPVHIYYHQSNFFSLIITTTTTMESILLKTISFHNHTLQQQVPFVGMDLSWLIEFLKGMVKPVCATAVVFLAVGLSFSQKLGLEVEMIIAILRAFVQLSIIGFVLQFIFNQQNSGWILLAYLFMVSFLLSHSFFNVLEEIH
jgi:hypothetical protein